MKDFADIKIGDYVVCYDNLCHDYDQHCLYIMDIEYDEDSVTDTNPEGKKFLGKEFDEERWGDNYLTWVTEENFCRILD